MIVPDGHPAAFGDASDGDPRADAGVRHRISGRLRVPPEWAFARQVHGAEVVVADQPGAVGEADGLVTITPGVPVAVFTADCFPVVLSGPGATGIAHAGWRGAAAGVVRMVREVMEEAGAPPMRAAVGPGIGPCCFEVGSEVATRFPFQRAATSWGTPSVDLPAVLRDDLAGLEIWEAALCTRHDDGYHSHRRDGTKQRQVTVGWISLD